MGPPWQLVYSASGARALDGLDKSIASRIEQAIEDYARSGVGDVKALNSNERLFRLRIGPVRVIFQFEMQATGASSVVVVSVGQRGGIYRDV